MTPLSRRQWIQCLGQGQGEERFPAKISWLPLVDCARQFVGLSDTGDKFDGVVCVTRGSIA